MLIKDNQTLPLQEIVTGDKICNCCAVLKIEQFWKTTLFRIFFIKRTRVYCQSFQRFSNPLDLAQVLALRRFFLSVSKNLTQTIVVLLENECHGEALSSVE